MAKGLAIASLQILSLLLLASLGQSKTVFTNLTIYDHEFQSGDCQTVFPVAGLNGTGELYQFGTVVVIDNILTRGFSIKSALLGRSQGIAAVTSPDGNNAELLLTFLFTNGTYSGSTVEIKGIFIGSLDVNELAIVGGTKQFRYATGYTTFQVVSQVGDHLIVKVNLYIRQDIPDDYPGIANH
ncbi:dirigent protein 11-like [Coffea arabica]|uniref:Dirigent protein n=1 Tax=Coffea arabica TaxID=13443 RepID=A0A6P6S3Q0_COFAR|nr:dirigent protein 11-like [Coffea arabica]